MVDKELDKLLPGRRIIPCPFCGGVPLAARSEKHVYIICDDCGACGPPAEISETGKEKALEYAIELWNWRDVVEETEYWAWKVERAVANARAGFLEHARAMSMPGVSFTAEQDAAIKAAVEMGNTAEAQRMILDALEKALDIEPHS